LRNITIPSADPEDWDKMRTIIVTFLMPVAFLVLNSDIHPDIDDGEKSKILLILGICLIPSLLLAIFVTLFTTSEVPPNGVNFFYSILALVMSVWWIKAASGTVVDVITLFG